MFQNSPKIQKIPEECSLEEFYSLKKIDDIKVLLNFIYDGPLFKSFVQ